MEKQRIYSKQEALSIYVNAAQTYNKNLENRDLLIIYKNGKNVKSYKIEFLAVNFLHFTGTKSKLSALDFYNAALNSRLRTEDFIFKNNELASQKLNVLEKAFEFPTTAKMIGLYNGPRIQLNADVGAGNVQYVITLRKDAKRGNEWLYPVGVQEEDIRDVTTKSPIIAILRKNNSDLKYDEITYKSKNINLDNLHFPKDLTSLMSEKALQSLKPTMVEEKKVVKENAPQCPRHTSLRDRVATHKEVADMRNQEQQALRPGKTKKHNHEI